MDNDFEKYQELWGDRDRLMLNVVDDDIRHIYEALLKCLWAPREPAKVQIARSLKKIIFQLDDMLKFITDTRRTSQT
jgi:hypothetical protein